MAQTKHNLLCNGWSLDTLHDSMRRDLPALGDPYLYDYDAPGFKDLGNMANDPKHPDPFYVGCFQRVRQNFLTYANYKIADAYGRIPTRCSRITAFYIDQSIEKWTSIWDGMKDINTGWWAEWFEWQPRNDVPGDNNAAVGHGNGLNWNLTNLPNIAGGQP